MDRSYHTYHTVYSTNVSSTIMPTAAGGSDEKCFDLAARLQVIGSVISQLGKVFKYAK